MNLKRPVSSWIDLDETAFHEMLLEDISRTGEIGDVFPIMVMHNVPHFVLAGLWPEKWKEYRRSPVPIAFAAAEDGWKGRIKNIQSSLGPEEAGGKRALQISKTYVISSDHVLALVRDGRGYALAYLNSFDGLEKTVRQEPHTWMNSGENGRVEHARVTGKVALGPENFRTLSSSDYSKVGREIPLREITSVAVLSTGARRFYGIGKSEADDEARAIMNSRTPAGIPLEMVPRAVGLLRSFLSDAQAAGLVLHDFWNKALEYASFAPQRPSAGS